MKAVTVEPGRAGSARPEELASALKREPDDVKVVIPFSEA